MTAAGQAGGGQPRGVFEVDVGRALAELELTWAGGGYHGFSADGGAWSAISSAGDVLTGDTSVRGNLSSGSGEFSDDFGN